MLLIFCFCEHTLFTSWKHPGTSPRVQTGWCCSLRSGRGQGPSWFLRLVFFCGSLRSWYAFFCWWCWCFILIFFDTWETVDVLFLHLNFDDCWVMNGLFSQRMEVGQRGSPPKSGLVSDISSETLGMKALGSPQVGALGLETLSDPEAFLRAWDASQPQKAPIWGWFIPPVVKWAIVYGDYHSLLTLLEGKPNQSSTWWWTSPLFRFFWDVLLFFDPIPPLNQDENHQLFVLFLLFAVTPQQDSLDMFLSGEDRDSGLGWLDGGIPADCRYRRYLVCLIQPIPKQEPKQLKSTWESTRS